MSEWRVECLPVEPLGVLVLFAGILWLVWRESRQFSGKKRGAWNTLRGVECLLFLGILLRVTLVETIPSQPRLFLLLDGSPSMAFPDGRGEEGTHAAGVFSEKLGAAQKTLVSGATSPWGEKLVETLKTEAPDAMIFVSDGIVTNGLSLEEAGRRAAQRGVPVFPILCGRTEPLPRLSARLEETRMHLQTGEPAAFTVYVEAEKLAGKALFCRLGDGKKTLTETTLTPESDAVSELRTTLRWTPPEAGEYSLFLTVSVGKATTPRLCRILPLTLRVSEGTRNVLLVAQTPDWEYRYLRNLLRREKGFVLKTWLASAGNDATEQDETALETFPDETALETFDIVILDDCDASLGGDALATSLVRFVEKGKGKALGVLSGRESRLRTWRGTALEKILPFSLTGAVWHKEPATIRPTSQAVNTPISSLKGWQEMPEIPSWWEFPHVYPGVRVLAEWTQGEKTFPALLYRRTGKGAVWVHAMGSTWRWRWRNDEDFYREYWISMLHWLATGETSDARHEATLSASLEEVSEYARTAADETAMRKLAERSGGRFFHASDTATAAREIFLTLENRPHQDTEGTRYPVGEHPATFGLLLFLLAVQWGIRRYAGS
ncbi:MAG: hypothetical protein Q4D98_00305 [Planctomycetia bacterium]|nr:hypothetical protein [Planctomycetia bacterium]